MLWRESVDFLGGYTSADWSLSNISRDLILSVSVKFQTRGQDMLTMCLHSCLSTAGPVLECSYAIAQCMFCSVFASTSVQHWCVIVCSSPHDVFMQLPNAGYVVFCSSASIEWPRLERILQEPQGLLTASPAQSFGATEHKFRPF